METWDQSAGMPISDRNQSGNIGGASLRLVSPRPELQPGKLPSADPAVRNRARKVIPGCSDEEGDRPSDGKDDPLMLAGPNAWHRSRRLNPRSDTAPADGPVRSGRGAALPAAV